MLANSIPIKIKAFLNLIRFNQPTGFLLLMWPCWFALASLPVNHIKNIKWYFIFFVGSFLMRSAGCIINDLIDINLDKKIKRTSQRPLVIKSITITQAIIFLLILLFLSLILLMQFNFKTIILASISIPLIIIYPLMKRFTYWPQLFLGIVFNWGVLIVFMQFYENLSLVSIILYIGCIFWTIGYDTIYAYQDREDDIVNNIKSTAVLFNKQGKYYVLFFYIIFLINLGYIGFHTSGSIASILILLMFLIAILFFLNKWKLESKRSANNYFRFNNIFGLFCFIYLIIF